MAGKIVAVLRGGMGDEHEVSLRSGAAVLRELAATRDHENISTIDIFIDRAGTWHVRGVPRSPERALTGVDVVWNALHGMYGEDGGVQRELDRIGIPYSGSGAYASTLAMNKAAAKRALGHAGIRTPRSVLLSVTPTLEQELVTLFRSFPQPTIVKPVASGSSFGVTLARSFGEFEEGVRRAFQHTGQVLIEEYVRGKEATVGIVDQFRGSARYALPPVEITPKRTSVFFDYNAKYCGEADERCPGTFSDAETRALVEAALAAHKHLGLRHYSRSDFIVSPRGVYFLEANTLPGTTEESLFPKSLSAVGSSLGEFVEHVLGLAIGKR
ncbi:MAG: D-alanine--D-alanine ligase [Candidatus Paceibacteria bacterium]